MPVQSPAASAAIVPFWNRLPAVMRYPLHGAAMATIVLLALGRLVGFLPLVGIIPLLLLIVAMYKYCFECLRATADGYLQPPDTGWSTSNSIGWKFIGLIIVLLIMGAVGVSMLGPGAATLILLAIGLVLPGATMTLAMEESLSEALTPTRWLTIMMAIGWPYLAVVGLCFVIMLSESYATHFVKGLLPLPIAIVAIGIISNYALVMTFHLMGYLIYQYHEEIGFVPEATQLAGPAPRVDPARQSLEEVGELVRDGKLDEAIERTRGLLRGNGGSPAVNAQYRKLLRAAGDQAGLLAHGRDYLANLIANEDDRGAVDLLRECQAMDPAFAPATALQITQLAHMASRQKQPQAALLLLQDFGARFPKSQYVAVNGLLAAELLHEHMGRDEEACEILRHVKTTAPNDQLMAEVDAKLQAIERMIAATKKPVRPPA